MAAQGKQTDGVARRDLLKLSALGAVAAGTASTLTGREAEAAKPAGKGAGYRETAHVKTFYDLARF